LVSITLSLEAISERFKGKSNYIENQVLDKHPEQSEKNLITILTTRSGWRRR